jgi:SAM-dependent methyltransferase
MDEYYKKAVLSYRINGTKTKIITGPSKFNIVDEFLLNLFKSKDKITIADLGGVYESYKHFKQLFPNSFIYTVNLVKEQIKGVEHPLLEDVLKTSLKDNSIDVAFAGDIIEHIVDTDKFIEEVYRILKPERFLILTTPNLCDWLNRIFILLGFSPHNYNPTEYKFGTPFFSGKGVWHKSVFTLRCLKEFLKSHKFKVLRAKGYTYSEEGSPLKTIRKIANYVLPTSWKEGLCILAQK